MCEHRRTVFALCMPNTSLHLRVSASVAGSIETWRPLQPNPSHRSYRCRLLSPPGRSYQTGFEYGEGWKPLALAGRVVTRSSLLPLIQKVSGIPRALSLHTLALYRRLISNSEHVLATTLPIVSTTR